MKTMNRTKGRNRLAAWRAGRLISKALMWGGVALGCVENATGQTSPVLWQTEDAVPDRPPGTRHTWNGTAYVQSTLTAPEAHTPAESGVDWHNCVTKLYDGNGFHYGYATVGYSWISLWNATEPCFADPMAFGNPAPLGGEVPGFEIGDQTATIAVYDLNGARLWYHSYCRGTLEGVIQDKDGNIVATGATGTRAPWPGTPWATQPFYINPTTGLQTDVSDPSFSCASNWSQLLVIKVEPINGNVIWNHVFTDEPVLTDAYTIRTHGSALAEVDPDGIGGYRVAGWRKGPQDGDPVSKERPFILDLDVNGYLNWKKLYNASNSSMTTTSNPNPGSTVTAFDLGDSDGRAIWIEHHPDPSVEQYIISGFRRDVQNSLPNFPTAYVMYFDENNAQDPVWIEDTGLNASEYPMTSASQRESSYRCSFAVDNGTTTILWPVLTDFYSAITATPQHEAIGRVFHLDLNSAQLWPGGTDLGWMRGYDLYMDAIQMANGDVAVSCTKSVISVANQNLPTWSMLDPNVQACVAGADPSTAVFDGLLDYDTDPNTPGVQAFDWQNSINLNNCGHWFSNSYVAVLSFANGALTWDYEIDADAENGTTSNCVPDNFRRRQCSFKIVQADDDGGLVICGNTGRNIEDAYLVKVQACELDPALYTDFHALYPYDPGHVYTLTANTTWNASMNVEGSVVVPAGVVLTINNNAVIGFADSRKIGYTTNLVVQPGGKTIIDGNATLTNIGPCGDGIWDGILALGNNSSSTNSTAQGTVELIDGTIENSFTAILGGNADPTDPINSAVTQRGARIICTGGTLRNNVHGVILRNVVHSSVVTRFYNVDFVTTGALNYPGLTPMVHLYAKNYTRINVKGCSFDGDPSVTGTSNVAGWGKGIESYNTDLRIEPLNGENPSFTGLRSGCFAVNIGGPTVRVNGAFFTGCGHGLGIVGAGSAHVTNCDFKEPDLDMVGQGLGAPVYGTYLEETPVILFEDNAFLTAPGNNDYACVGSTFVEIGAASNMYRNNRYDGFDCLNCTTVESAGTTIQGLNDGLQFRCNQYSGTYPNAYDIAFTGGNVTVSPQQGAILPVVDPAGNTFALNCTGEQHFYNDGGVTGINLFTYYHHTPQGGVELVPTCMSIPLTTAINQNTNEFYTGCAGPQNLIMASAGDQSAAAANAASEYAVLKAVYDDWSDGGDAEGLKEFVADLGNSSYAIRNQLMLVAPKVSDEVWKEVFMRIEDMNPWHLAQALIANSPLEPPVLAMLENSSLMPYYKQMVANEQGGMSMQMIKQSELTYWRDQQTQALQAYTSRAYDEVPTVTYAEAIALHQQYPVEGSAEQIMLLHLANNDLTSARTCVNTALAADHTAWWEVQDMYLNQLENGLDMETLDPAQEAQLTAIAAGTGPGTSNAKAWLAAFGEPLQANVVLPSMTRSFQQGQQTGTDDVDFENIGAFPNPSQGEAFLTYTLPEGMDAAELHVFDATGRIIWQQVTGRSSGIAEIPTPLPAGLYQAVLRGNGVFVGSTKFTVVR